MTTSWTLNIISEERDARKALADFVDLLNMDSSKSVQLIKRSSIEWEILVMFDPEDMESEQDLQTAHSYMGKVRTILELLCMDKTTRPWRAMN